MLVMLISLTSSFLRSIRVVTAMDHRSTVRIAGRSGSGAPIEIRPDALAQLSNIRDKGGIYSQILHAGDREGHAANPVTVPISRRLDIVLSREASRIILTRSVGAGGGRTTG